GGAAGALGSVRAAGAAGVAGAGGERGAGVAGAGRPLGRGVHHCLPQTGRPQEPASTGSRRITARSTSWRPSPRRPVAHWWRRRISTPTKSVASRPPQAIWVLASQVVPGTRSKRSAVGLQL